MLLKQDCKAKTPAIRNLAPSSAGICGVFKLIRLHLVLEFGNAAEKTAVVGSCPRMCGDGEHRQQQKKRRATHSSPAARFP